MKYVRATTPAAKNDKIAQNINTLLQAPFVSKTRYGTIKPIETVPMYPMPSMNPVEHATTWSSTNLDGIVVTRNTCGP